MKWRGLVLNFSLHVVGFCTSCFVSLFLVHSICLYLILPHCWRCSLWLSSGSGQRETLTLARAGSRGFIDWLARVSCWPWIGSYGLAPIRARPVTSLECGTTDISALSHLTYQIRNTDFHVTRGRGLPYSVSYSVLCQNPSQKNTVYSVGISNSSETVLLAFCWSQSIIFTQTKYGHSESDLRFAIWWRGSAPHASKVLVFFHMTSRTEFCLLLCFFHCFCHWASRKTMSCHYNGSLWAKMAKKCR